MTRRRLALGLLGCLLLVGCSGGGGDDPDDDVAMTRPSAGATTGSAASTAEAAVASDAPAALPSPEPAPADAGTPASRPSPAAPKPSARSAPPQSTPAPQPRPSPATSPAPRPSPRPAPAPSARALTIENFAFSPRTMTVDRGTTVTATNKDEASHTWTADNGEWDSGSLGKGESFPFTFRTAGSYSFYCKPHPLMTGSITVR